MREYRRITGVNPLDLSASVYERICFLLGVVPTRKRIPLEIQGEERVVDWAQIEALLKESDYQMSPFGSLEEVDWDSYFDSKNCSFVISRDYERKDLSLYQWGLVRPQGSLSELSPKSHFEDVGGMGSFMSTESLKIIADAHVMAGMMNALGGEMMPIDIVVERKGKVLENGRYFWLKAVHAAPGMSPERNQFFDSKGKLCSYESVNRSGVYAGDYDHFELVYKKSDLIKFSDRSFVRTKEEFGAHIRGPFTLWSVRAIDVLYQMNVSFKWYPIHFA
jgi:hypothetical protein